MAISEYQGVLASTKELEKALKTNTKALKKQMDKLTELVNEKELQTKEVQEKLMNAINSIESSSKECLKTIETMTEKGTEAFEQQSGKFNVFLDEAIKQTMDKLIELVNEKELQIKEVQEKLTNTITVIESSSTACLETIKTITDRGTETIIEQSGKFDVFLAHAKDELNQTRTALAANLKKEQEKILLNFTQVISGLEHKMKRQWISTISLFVFGFAFGAILIYFLYKGL